LSASSRSYLLPLRGKTDTNTFACSELRALPEDLHLFCPRTGDDASGYYDEDLAGTDQDDDADTISQRKEKIKQAEERKWLALDALQVLAFDGEEAEPFQAWITERVNGLMTSCDVCVRIFHQSRAAWKARLVEYAFNLYLCAYPY
jgi:senataxin